LFDSLKSKKKKSKKETPKAAPKDVNDGFGGRSMAGSGRKYTEEGFPIYTEEELGLNGKGGDTPDCPFDCKCCV
jgi:hypothetical protein